MAGLGVLPGRVARLPDGVKRPQMQWNRLMLEPARPSAGRGAGRGPVGLLRPLVRPAGRADGGGGHVRLRRAGGGRRGGRDRCGRPSSIPRSRAPTGLALLANFVAARPPAAAELTRGALPGHRPAGRPLRAPGRGRLRAARPSTATTRSRWPRLSRPPAPGGSTSSTWTRPAPASRSTGRWSLASRPRSRGAACGSRRAAGCATVDDAERAARRGRGPGGGRHRGGGAPRAGGRDRRPLARAGGGRPRPPGRARCGCGAGPRAAAGRSPSSCPAAVGGRGGRGDRHRHRPRRSPGRSRRGRAGRAAGRDRGADHRLRRGPGPRRPPGPGCGRDPRAGTVRGLAGVIAGKAIYEGALDVGAALADVRGRRRHEGRPGHPLPRRRRRPGGQRGQVPRTCATPATRWSWPPATTRRAPTSWSSTTSPPRPTARDTMVEVVARTAEQVFIPLTVGGGVRTLDDARRLLRVGADKVSVNSAAVARAGADRRAGRHLRRPSASSSASTSAGPVAASRSTPTAGGRPTGRRRHRLGRRSASDGAPARSCSTRWTATAPATASTSS